MLYPPGGLKQRSLHNQEHGLILSRVKITSGDFMFCTKKVDIEDYKHPATYLVTINADKINGLKNCEWDTNKGRWFIGLYSNDSDEKDKRITSQKA